MIYKITLATLTRDYEIEADDKDEAIATAMELFSECDPDVVNIEEIDEDE